MAHDLNIVDRSSETEIGSRQEFVEMFKNRPIPDDEVLHHLGLYANRQLIARMLWMHEIYQQVLNVPGVIMEFGVRWGQNLALFQSFRGIYEPYNYTRRVIGFDTFSGFCGTSESDGSAEIIQEGAYDVTPSYEDYLAKVLQHHEKESPISHIKKHTLIKGNASQTIHQYFEENPETIVALAYFNMDIYQPTRDCLAALKGRLVKGSVIGFDELNCPHFPGETRALQDVMGLENCRLVRTPHNPYPAYLVVE